MMGVVGGYNEALCLYVHTLDFHGWCVIIKDT